MARMAKWRRHTLEFKRQAVERMKTCPNVEKLARELKIQRKNCCTPGNISSKAARNRGTRIWELPRKTAKRNTYARRSPD